MEVSIILLEPSNLAFKYLVIKKASIFLVLILIVIGLGWGISKYLDKKNILLTPLSLLSGPQKTKSEYKVVGFLPTWMIGKTITYGKELDSLIFLGVGVDEKGNLIWETQANKIESEDYIKIKNEIKRNGGTNILGIKLFEDDLLEKLMADKQAQKRLIDQLKTEIIKGGFDGVNVDFEYQSSPVKVLAPEFIEFLGELKRANLGEISLDVFVNTLIKGDKISIVKLMDNVDEIIVMAYDFHRPGMDYTGPVAPIRSPIGERSIWETVERINILGIESKKIIFAYPLYGYEWKTETNEYGAKINRGWYQMASLRRLEEEILPSMATMSGQINWDETSMTPWLSFVEDGEIRQIYYENEKSLKIKMDLVKQAKLKGVGFWALGYEPEESKFWSKIEEMLEN